MITVIFLGIATDMVVASYAQQKLDLYAQTCALQSARAISESTFYSSGKIQPNYPLASSDLRDCIVGNGNNRYLEIFAYHASTNLNNVSVSLVAHFHPPFGGSLLSRLDSITLTATSTATEQIVN